MTVMAGVRDDQQNAVDAGIAALQREPPAEGLRVAEPRLGLHRHRPAGPVDDLVPGSAVARNAEWNLGPVSKAGRQWGAEAREQLQRSSVSHGVVARVRPQRDVETE